MPQDKFAKARAFAAHLASSRVCREGEWHELSRWLAPHRGLFTGEDLAPRETRRNKNGFTNPACQALLRGASGITSGMTPRNISWFKPDFHDPEMTEASGARAWLDRLDTLMKDCLTAGGFYQAIHSFNIDLLWSGCAMLYAESGLGNLMRFECVQIGTFCVALDSEGMLDAAVRSIAMTPAEIARVFGKSSMSEATRSQLNTNPYTPHRVWHLVRRRDWRDPGKLDRRNMPWESLFWEDSSSDFLSEGGYNEMPYYFTCWHPGATPYGTGPGDDALPDIRQLDLLERRKLEGLAKLVNPPLQVPSKLKETVDFSPGGMTHTPEDVTIQPIINLAPYASSLPHLQAEIQNIATRLEQELMASIFASMPLDQRPRDMSATEFLERKREALQQLGPVISAYEPNVLTPLLYRVQGMLDRAGLLPPLPNALQGYPVATRMDFISPMANALRQTGAETTRALFSDVSGMVQATQNMEILDKIDLDQMIDELATGLGVPGKIIRSDDDVAQMRQERAQQQQQHQAMQMQMLQERAASQNVKDIAQAAQAAGLTESGEEGM